MATPKQLVAKVSELTGVPEGTVVLHDRNLLNAGLRSEGQRGRGKSVVTYDDAANLLIAVAGSRNVKDSAKTVKHYAPLPASAPMEFDDVKRGKTFGDALAALLEAIPNCRDAFAGPDGDWIEVSLFGPDPSAKIEWKRYSKDSPTIGDSWLFKPSWNRGERRAPFSDLLFIAKFTQVTIGHLGELIAGSS